MSDYCTPAVAVSGVVVAFLFALSALSASTSALWEASNASRAFCISSRTAFPASLITGDEADAFAEISDYLNIHANKIQSGEVPL